MDLFESRNTRFRTARFLRESLSGALSMESAFLCPFGE